MSADGDHVRVVVEIDQDEDGFPGVGAEGLWCTPSGEHFRVDNIPFFARGLACEDIVSAEKVDGTLRLGQVVSRSGHATLWLYCTTITARDEVRVRLRKMGCASEVSHLPMYIAVDVPMEVDRAVLRRLLDLGEREQRWEWAEGVPL